MLQPDFKLRISHLLGSMTFLVSSQVELYIYVHSNDLVFNTTFLPFWLSSLFPFFPPAERTSTPKSSSYENNGDNILRSPENFLLCITDTWVVTVKSGSCYTSNGRGFSDDKLPSNPSRITCFFMDTRFVIIWQRAFCFS